MESKIDELLHLSYKNGKYQKLVLFFCFLTWINSNIFNTSIELLGQRARVIDPFNSSITDELNDDLCEKIIKDTNNTYKFKRNINSIISSLNYDCDKFGISLFSISPYIGNIFGGAIYIYISNHRTYKSLIFTASTCFVIVLTCISIPTNFIFISGGLMISSIMANSILCSTFMLGIENEIGKRRTRFTMIVYLGYLICKFVYPTLLMRIVELNWRGVFGFCVIITGVIELFFYFYTVESPRTLMMLNRNSDAVDSLRYIAQCNGVEKKFEEKIKSNEYKDIISSMKKDKEIDLYNKSDRGVKALFKSKKDFKCCMIFNCIWFTVHMSKNFLFEILFDLDLNFNFTSYVYLDIVMQIVGIILISFLIEVKFLGRNRTLYLTCFIFTFVYSLYNVFDSNDQKTEGIVANVVYYLAIFLSLLFSGCKCLLYTYSVESYPTNLLATAFGLNMISASVGNIIGTLLEAHCGEVGEWIFSGLILISGVMAMFLEETRDQSEEKITEGLSLVKANEFDDE